MAGGEAVDWQKVGGVVVAGYGVASGQGEGSPYPAGSIALQVPFFRERGLDLDGYFLGTLNVDVAPFEFVMQQPVYCFRQVGWWGEIPPEDFSFQVCRLGVGGRLYEGLVYFPHPETKPAHGQRPCVVEVLAERILGVGYGDDVEVWLPVGSLRLMA